MLDALVLNEEEGTWTELDDLDKIAELAATPGHLVWGFADVRALTSYDATQLVQAFRLHPLAMDDAMNARQRPKLEAYDRHLFSVMHQLDTVDGHLEATQIGCFVGRRFVLTLHAGAERTLSEASRRCFKGTRLADQGPSYIMHNLLDTIVDDYQRITDELESHIEDLEERALANPRDLLQADIYATKQRLARLRRYVFPGERVLAAVTEAGRFNLITKRTAAQFRDVHDHTLRIIDQVRNIDDLAEAVIDLQRAEAGQALNVAQRRLAGWAAIIAIPTLIASVYGMNFATLPGTGTRNGFWVMLGVMLAAAGTLFTVLRRNHWL
jgi:magnesium transporter